MKDFGHHKSKISAAMRLGIDVEMDDPFMRHLVEPLAQLPLESLEWLASWLVGEGVGDLSA